MDGQGHGANAGSTTLVVGATGATGRFLVQQLLDRGQRVKVIVRSSEKLPERLRDRSDVDVIEATLLDLSDAEMARLVEGCSSVASCLGHNLDLSGIFGQPRRLVTEATRRLCAAIKRKPLEQPVKFVLMNTAGNGNRDIDEPVSLGQRLVLGLLRLLLPPHADNEQAADHLRLEIGQDDAAVHWSVVRPDALIDKAEVSEYEVHPSPIRSAIFDAGVTSRINVSHFMASLIVDEDTWNTWRGRMPVIYDKAVSSR